MTEHLTEYLTFKIIGTPHIIKSQYPTLNNTAVIACEIDNYPYMLKLTHTLYKGILAELKKHNITIDDNLTCLEGKIFTMTHMKWKTALKELWLDEEIPLVTGITLRTDLCMMDSTSNNTTTNTIG